MFKIGIVGSDNSHADAFSKLLNVGFDPNDEQAKLLCPDLKASGNAVFPFPNYKVTAIFGTDEKRNKEVAEVGKIPYIAKTPEELFDKVDGVMVVWRHGGLHAKYALPFIEKGMPTWIDKPFTIDPKDTDAIFAAAKKSGAVVAGGSTVKYVPAILDCKKTVEAAGDQFKGGSMTYAVSMENDYGNLFFYSQHLVECALEVFGYGVKSVFGAADGKNATAILKYADKDCVLHFVSENYRYRVMMHLGKETDYRDFDIPGSYFYGFSEFAKAIEAKKTLLSEAHMKEAVNVLWAIDQSIKTGKEITL
ncbi:MAG TPA: Gfo/Idh/MocA family oxidoreductase [Oscillospiraceae bacterium]|nr:Gfo/Idh/MocA family oxidoreductase [Oscillospiraceae bacterium]HPF54986.1 Gfo/Idh/MocA family oxidoreductase [Clostridiales bacterium]HPK34399.1 Gfo/Idh/MocA family oxidoreductase [Oscillospiraceae bacterium]